MSRPRPGGGDGGSAQGGCPGPDLGWGVGAVSRTRPGREVVSAQGGPGPGPRGCIPACTETDTNPSRRLLLRTVRILLECILVLKISTVLCIALNRAYLHSQHPSSCFLCLAVSMAW